MTPAKILKKYWLFLVLWMVALLWFSLFSVEVPARWITSNLPREGGYFLASLVGYLIIIKLRIRNLEIGWGIITTGLLIDFLSEFTGEPVIITNLKSIITVLGIILIATGFYKVTTYQERIGKEIRAERDLLQALMDNIPDHVYFKDEKNRFIRVNKAKAEAADTTPEEMIGKTDFDFFPEEEAKKAFADDNYVRQSGKPIVDRLEERIFSDGKKHWISSTKIPRYDQEGKIVGTMGISRDITERKKMEEKLRESEERFRILAERSPVGIYLIQDNLFKYVNPKFAETSGYRVDELIEKKGPKDITYPDDWPLVEENLRKRIEGKLEFGNYAFRVMKKQGEIFNAEVFDSGVIYQGKPAVIGILFDITERKEAEKILWELSRRDYLTGLFNYRYFYEKLREEMDRFRRYGEVFSLLYIDIDSFKTCNDTYGHLEGDKVLRILSKILQKSLRKIDSAYRVGGEEFVVMLPHTSKEKAKKVAMRICEDVRERLYPRYGITVSIGVADSKVDDVVKVADKAMYEAKRRGKDRVWIAE